MESVYTTGLMRLLPCMSGFQSLSESGPRRPWISASGGCMGEQHISALIS